MKKLIVQILINSRCYWLFPLKERLEIFKSNLKFHLEEKPCAQ